MMLALAGLLGSCTSGAEPRVPGAPEAGIPQTAVPPVLGSLAASETDVTKEFAQTKQRAYVTAVRLWSLREGDRLRGTIQVSRFAPDAEPGDAAFQRSVVTQVGKSATPQVRRVAGQRVYVTTGDRQTIFMWFRGIHFILMSVSVDHPYPRSLLRETLKEVLV